MLRRNWSVIFPIAAIAGYATFSFWGAFIGPVIALAAYGWLDRREGSHARKNEEERFAAFMQRADAAPAEPEPPAVPPSPADLPPASRAEIASRSIALALRAGDSALAVGLYAEFSSLREECALDAGALNRLGAALLDRRAYPDAAWALHAGAIAAGDEAGAAKRLAEVAGLAAGADRTETARQLYLELVARYPDASLASFAQARVGELERPANDAS